MRRPPTAHCVNASRWRLRLTARTTPIFSITPAVSFTSLTRTNLGTLEFGFEGVVMTDAADVRTIGCDLRAKLVRETCDWLTEPVVRWFEETVSRAVAVEFDRYIEAGDLEQAKLRLRKLEDLSDASGGYLGLYL